jgi:phage replication O-like protein O
VPEESEPGMANPQKENGYTAIANEILENLCKINLSPYESRVLLLLLRETYGWKWKLAHITLKDFGKKTGLDRRLVHRALRGLSSKKMTVIGRDDKNRPTIGFQKDFDQWIFPIRPRRPVIGRDDKSSSVEMTTPELSLYERKKEILRGNRSGKAPDPRVKEYLSWFSSEYQKRFGTAYHVVFGRDGSLVKGVLRTFELPELQARTIRMWESTDKFIAATDRGIQVFTKFINRFAPSAQPQVQAAQRPQKFLTA